MATIVEIENLINLKLSPIIDTQNKILELLYTLNNTKPESKQESKPESNNTPKQPKKKTKELQYGDNIKALFNTNKLQYEQDRTITENLTNLCNAIDKSINIYTPKGECVYKHNEAKTIPVDYRITTEALTVINNPIVYQLGNKNTESNINDNEIKGATTKHFEIACKILNVKQSYNTFDIQNMIMKKAFNGVALQSLTNEEQYVLNMNRGNVVYLIEKNYTLTNKCYSYDINSFHPHILANSNFMFPVRKGTCINLDKVDSNVPGMYAIEIKNNIKYFMQANDTRAHSDNEDNINDKCWYSHYYIQLLERENIRYRLLKTNTYNAITYNESDMVKTSVLFGEQANALYKEKNPVTKYINQTLFGYMCSKDKHNTITKSKDEIDIHDIMNLGNIKKNITITENSIIIPNNDLSEYEYDMARIQIFFYDYCRVHLYDTYLKHHKVIRIATDSILIEGKINNEELIHNDIGGLKKEMLLKPGLVYPKANYSFKTHPHELAYVYNKDTKKYVCTLAE